jgi:sphinganine-1-phosphate aldolase
VKQAAERSTRLPLPQRGRPWPELERELRERKADDADWRRGRTGAYVFWASDEVLDVAKRASEMYFSENGLSPKAFPSLARMEREVLGHAADLLQGDHAVGSMTSGGTESIMVAVKTARDAMVAERGVEAPEIVMPYSAHPAFSKAAHYLGLRAIRTPLDADFGADVDALADAINERTVLVVGSAPQYPHGVVDPIPAMAAAAQARGVPFHVDACVGGFCLPFLRHAGVDVPPFDFAVPGVTSMSADLHKFGFTAKGASVVLYRDERLHRYQGFSCTEWPMGQYASPTVTGTRPAGPIAAAWAVLHTFGMEGYVALHTDILRIRDELFAGIRSVEGMEVYAEPIMGCFGYGSRTLDMAAIAEGMEELGWFVNRQADPPGIHMFVTPAHGQAVERYVADLAAVSGAVRRGERRAKGTSEIRYSG